MQSGIVNIAAHLPAMAERLPHMPGVVFPHGRDKAGRVAYTHFTFAQLECESNLIASGLEKFGIRRGMRTALMVKPGLEFFALTFALFKAGVVPVLIDPGMGLKNLKTCLGEARPDAFIGITAAHLARKILGWPAMKHLVTVGTRLFWGGKTLDEIKAMGSPLYQPAETAAQDVAAILFTSGSTGVPKGAVYTHGIFATQVAILRRMYDIRPGEVDLATFPLFALFAPALGMTAIVPDMDATRPAKVDPLKIIEAVENFGVTNMFGSPALLETVSRYTEQAGVVLPSLKRVISAGAPVQPLILERVAKMLTGGAQTHTPYGATESLPVCTIGSDEILGETGAGTYEGRGVCVGRPVDEVQLRIINISDVAIENWSDDLLVEPGRIGEITVKGPMVTHAYFNRDASTKLAKIRDTDGAIIHRMGDLGYVDDQGRVWFCGRKTHRVNTARGVLYTVPCEGIFNAHPKVYRTALVGVGQGDFKEPVICVELQQEHKSAGHDQVRRELLELATKHLITMNIKTFLFHDAFPVDIRHNAKIFREKLRPWAEKRMPRA